MIKSHSHIPAGKVPPQLNYGPVPYAAGGGHGHGLYASHGGYAHGGPALYGGHGGYGPIGAYSYAHPIFAPYIGYWKCELNSN
jgi:hypothetical protein